MYPAKSAKTNAPNTALRALSAAALALPGLAPSPSSAANGDQATFQYGYYEEGMRNILESYAPLNLKPIRVDNILANANMTFADRLKLGFDYIQDTWSGATPLTTAPAAAMTLLASGASMAINSTVLLDKKSHAFYRHDARGNRVPDQRTVHMMTMASPETRKQGSAHLGYDWDDLSLDLGGGVSSEDDYDSYFLNTSGHLNFNNKLSTVNWGLNYTNSTITAWRDPQYAGYIDYATLFDRDFLNSKDAAGNLLPLPGERQDWAVNLGFSQVLHKNTVLESSIGYTFSEGFLENPYKVVELLFIDPAQYANKSPWLFAQTQGVSERRPNQRHQLTFSTRLAQYFQPTDAAIHLGYRFFHDDWGIDSHTFDADWVQPLGMGWSITPRVRYYTQDAADFYQPYFIIDQAKSFTSNFQTDYSQLPIEHFSSDHRLSGFGALSGGLTLSKQFSKGVSLDTSFEYYTHQGGLKLGGGAENDFADYDYYLINASLRVNLSALASASGGHSHHVHHTAQHAAAPAGVMFAHMAQANEFMAGYRYMYHWQQGDVLHQTHAVPDAEIVQSACGETRCSLSPAEHTMHMHMLDLMYAPTDWLTLMLMPQFVDMTMAFAELDGAPAAGAGHHAHGGSTMRHATGGLGDTGLYAMFGLFASGNHHLHLTLGVNAPTGDVEQKINGESFIHYGMQLGSGTWDFKPSLTYTGSANDWSWGLQVGGTKHLESQNVSGFAFGDSLQSTAWGSYSLFNWLSASVRGVHTVQDSISGKFNGPHDNSSPMDMPHNYGGTFGDVGFGLNAHVTGGDFQGNGFGIEWLQPVYEGGHGYQLEREGTLNASWSLAF